MQSNHSIQMHMKTRAAGLLVLLLAGCAPRKAEDPLAQNVEKLSSAKEEERDEAFRTLVLMGAGAEPGFKKAVAAGPKHGFPVVALLYSQGEGDAVPLDLRARHLAAFRWPGGMATETAIVEPFVWHELEADLVRAGRPALRYLSQALEKDSPGEAKALQAAGAMIRIGGRAAAAEFARLLAKERPLDGPRVCDVAAAALLHLGHQDLALRAADPEAVLGAARAWWEAAKDQSEEDWLRSSVAALAARWKPRDPEGVRGAMELLAGQTIEDPAAWLEKNRGWSPANPPARLEELLPRLAAGRAEAFEANRLLERATGHRVSMPRMDSLGSLRAALRLWEPDPDLGLRWKRWLGSEFLRLSILVVGHHPKRETNHLLWAEERYFQAGEDETAELTVTPPTGFYVLHAQSLDLGTRVVVGEYYSMPLGEGGFTKEVRAARPLILFSPALRSCIVIAIEEVAARQPLRPPDALFAQLRAQLRAQASTAEGDERSRALRALGYLQDPADAALLKEHGAGEALLLLGDPAALEFKPSLAAHEIEMALRKAKDERVRGYLEGLKGAALR